MYRRIRSFFDERGYLEIFTPTLSPTLIPESTIQNFRTRFLNEFVADRDFYLIIGADNWAAFDRQGFNRSHPRADHIAAFRFLSILPQT